MFREVPVLPVVVPLAAVLLVVLLLLLHRRGRLSAPRAGVAVVLCVYAAGVVANTVFPVYLDKPGGDRPWHAALALTPFAGYELADALMNVLVFVPVGVVVPLLARASWWRTLLVAVASSLAIELTQLVTAHLLGGGHVADTDDLLSNVAGALLGHALLVLACRVPALARVVERFRW